MTYDELLDKCFDLILSDEDVNQVQSKIDEMLSKSELKAKVLDALASLFTNSVDK